MQTEYLYMILLGGKHAHANVEVHDVLPMIGTDLLSLYPSLKDKWFGLKKGLHIDAWMKIHGVIYNDQPYQIHIQPFPAQETLLKLFLVNLGAYIPQQFGEIHKYIIVAGKNSADAKLQAKKAIEKTWFKPHTDAIIDVDDCVEIDLLEQQYIHLMPGEFTKNIFENDYILIP